MAAESPSGDADTPPPPSARRKFAVEPVETSSRSSKTDRARQKDNDQQPGRSALRFLPQPVEETSRSSRRGGPHASSAAVVAKGDSEKQANSSTTASSTAGTDRKKPRKFAVEPVETVKRVRRRNTGPALQPGDATDELSSDPKQPPKVRPKPRPPPEEGGPTSTTLSPPSNFSNPYNESAVGSSSESRFSYAALTRSLSRQSSMRKPTLEPISSVPESEESNFSKQSSSSSHSSAHEDAKRGFRVPGKRDLRTKESYEEVFSGYLLDMAARAAQQQLREQAAEAYPNERLHEPVDHFAAGRESDSDTEEGLGQLPNIRHEEFRDRRESSAGWDQAEIQHHRKTLQRQQQQEVQQQQQRQQQETPPDKGRRDAAPTKITLPLPKVDPTRISPSSPRKDPFGNQFNLAGIGAEGTDPEMKRMQDKARPPMLGGDLIFPKTQSPRTTLIDPLQRHGTRRNTGILSKRGSGLWTPTGMLSPKSPPPPPQCNSPENSVSLWGNTCTADQAVKMRSLFPEKMQTGIMTPQFAPDEDPFDRYAKDESLQQAQVIQQQLTEMQAVLKQQTVLPQQAARAQHQLPSQPGSRVQSILGIDQLLLMEQRIEIEYPDSFVTQIYNYLSLGYPAIARSYDDELSKISKMSVAEIRRGDARKNTKGYLGAPEGNGTTEVGAREDCNRWRALRLYIREWARQQPNMTAEGADATWGARARRGSWFA